MKNLLHCLGVDLSDAAQVDQATAEVRTLRPNIDDCFDGSETDKTICAVPKYPNPFPDRTYAYYIREVLSPGDWRDMQFISAYFERLPGVKDQNKIISALHVVADLWHPGNGGNSFLRQTRDSDGTILYRMEFTIPAPVIDLGFEAFGDIPHPRPDMLEKIQEEPDDESWRIQAQVAQQAQQRAGL
jgi:hypothetical protein